MVYKPLLAISVQTNLRVSKFITAVEKHSGLGGHVQVVVVGIVASDYRQQRAHAQPRAHAHTPTHASTPARRTLTPSRMLNGPPPQFPQYYGPFIVSTTRDPRFAITASNVLLVIGSLTSSRWTLVGFSHSLRDCLHTNAVSLYLGAPLYTPCVNCRNFRPPAHDRGSVVDISRPKHTEHLLM